MNKLLLMIFILPLLLGAQNVKSLQLEDVNGVTFKMAENLEHDATIIVFWATWCIPCKKEFPKIQELKEKYKDKDIQIITISKDSPRSLAKVKRFVKTNHYDFTYLLDPDGQVSTRLLVENIPHTMIVNPEGDVTYNLTGYRQGDEVEIENAMLKLWSE